MGWVKINSVNDLPEYPGEYLVYVKNMFNSGELFEELSYVTMAFFNKDQCLWNEDGTYYNACLDVVKKTNTYCITHWMPKPAGPVDLVKLEGENQNGSN